jgi:molybdopterin molybdotransferase
VTGLLTIDDALGRVLAHARPLEAEDVPVGSAAGRVLAEDARAATDLPPFDSSAMDGYAVRAGDTPGPLRVTGQAAAGRPAEQPLGPGEAIVISTGAVVPDGADAVVPIEQARGKVEVESVAKGENIRPQGGDICAGDVVLARGAALGPAQIGALAAAGIATVRCGRRPRAVVVATGTELRPPGEQLERGQIYESNTVMLAAQLASAGAEVEVHAVVVDDEAATRAGLARALEADVLVTSGGVSVGPHDLVRAVLADLGAEEVFWRVAVKPGKPVAFAVRDRTLVFGLPGNPVSSLVGFELFVRPAVRALQGARDPGPRYLPGQLGSAVRRSAQRDELVRARLGEDGALEPLTGQGSHMIARAALADALVLVPLGDGVIEAGAQVSWLQI